MSKVTIIAEIGNNHEGDASLAEKMILEASKAGVDAVKFQTSVPELFYHKDEVERIKKLNGFRLSDEAYKRLRHVAKEEGLMFISTPLDLESADFLFDLVDVYKISSGDNTYHALLKKVAVKGKDVIMSTGCSSDEEIDAALQVLQENKSNPQSKVTLLHCVSSYPVHPEEANLFSIPRMQKRFPGVDIGYSDHTLGIEAAVLSVALGAKVIEKHFTLDKNFSDFRDHQLSADAEEMKQLVDRVHEAAVLLGDITQETMSCEAEIAPHIRRSMVAAKKLAKGHVLGEADIRFARPGGGVPPEDEKKVLGLSLQTDVEEGDVIGLKDLA